MIKNKLKFQKGFTLIEMVIVIVVVGILMGLAFQGIAGVQRNARDTRRLADLRRVQTHLELYFNRCGHYPTTGSGSPATSCIAPAATPGGINDWSAFRNELALVVDIGEIPADDPVAGRDYMYRFGAQGIDYVLSASMEVRGNNPELRGGDVLGKNCDERFCIGN